MYTKLTKKSKLSAVKLYQFWNWWPELQSLPFKLPFRLCRNIFWVDSSHSFGPIIHNGHLIIFHASSYQNRHFGS